MKQRVAVLAGSLCVAATLSGCLENSVTDKPDPLAGDIIDEANLTQLMLTSADPDHAVRYFEQAVAREPERADFRRGLAASYARAQRYPEAARIYQELMALRQDQPADRLEYAYVAVHLDRWTDAEALANALPGTMETPRRFLLDAILADHRKDWEAADRAYARAEQLSTNPAKVLNNWGMSQVARSGFADAERLFERAISYDSRLFEAKNNLVLARGRQRNYRLPVVPMTDTERATLLYNLGLIALANEDKRAARGLFAEALASHPQYYQAAANRLAALESTIVN